MGSSISALKKLSRGELTAEDSTGQTPGQRKLSAGHRDNAIIETVRLEAHLEARLIKRMVKLTSREYDQLFVNNGPLATFSAKIQMGYALSLYGKAARNDLDKIRAIRNAFAHTSHNVTFKTKEVADVCRTLETPTRICDVEFGRYLPRPLTPHMLFWESVSVLSSMLTARDDENLEWFLA